jgi:hypothetical protein
MTTRRGYLTKQTERRWAVDTEVPYDLQLHVMSTVGQCFFHKVERFPVLHRDERDILGVRVTIIKAQSRISVRGGYCDYAIVGARCYYKFHETGA